MLRLQYYNVRKLSLSSSMNKICIRDILMLLYEEIYVMKQDHPGLSQTAFIPYVMTKVLHQTVISTKTNLDNATWWLRKLTSAKTKSRNNIE